MTDGKNVPNAKQIKEVNTGELKESNCRIKRDTLWKRILKSPFLKRNCIGRIKCRQSKVIPFHKVFEVIFNK